MQHLKIYTKQDILSLTKIRRFETKLGERVQFINQGVDLETAIANSTAKYVLFGIPEDIGSKANLNEGNTATLWIPFLQSFFNSQSNDFLDGNEILLIGHFDFGDLEYLIDTTAKSDEEKVEAYRHALHAVDDEVEHVAKLITTNKKIPIVIGGGHNNSYPLIKGAAKGWHKAGLTTLAQINCVNLDKYTLYGPLEGRHNGNPIRYAEEDGYLQKYCVVGLQESYIPQNVWVDIVNNPFIDCITFEDIFVHDKRTFLQAVSHATGFTEDTLTGVDIDLRSVQNTNTGAGNTTGISIENARKYISFAAADVKVAYLYICEGQAKLVDGKTDVSQGELANFLVADFVKGQQI